MKIAINHVKIFDGHSVLFPEGSLLFDETGILKIGAGPFPGDKTIDGTGKTVTPGLIDTHVHLGMNGIVSFSGQRELIEAGARLAAQAQAVWQYGITTLCNCGTDGDADIFVRDMIREGEIPGARIIACGRGISITGGHGWIMNHQADDDTAALTAARIQLRSGADLVKLFATGGMGTKGSVPSAAQLAESQMKVCVEAAESVGALTRAHATGLEGAQRAIRAGVRIIDHVQMDEATACLMAEHGAFYCPTIVTRYNILHMEDPAYQYMRAKADPADLERKKRALQLCREKGITVVAGTDGGPDQLTPLGSSLWKELEIYHEYGMSCGQALTAATADAAKALKIERTTGTLACGMAADIALFDGDPTESIEDLEQLSMTFQNGRLVYLDTARVCLLADPLPKTICYLLFSFFPLP